MKSSKSSSPKGLSRATTFPPSGNSFIYTETNQNESDSENIFNSFERTDIIQITNIPFYYNR